MLMILWNISIWKHRECVPKVQKIAAAAPCQFRKTRLGGRLGCRTCRGVALP